MIRKTCAATLALLVCAFDAGADPTETAARRAVAAMKDASVLPTPCERAFQSFWTVFSRPGDDGILRDGSGPGTGSIFGYGNRAALPLLLEAQRVCGAETGAPGALVTRILREGAVAKRERLEERKATQRLIKGF